MTRMWGLREEEKRKGETGEEGKGERDKETGLREEHGKAQRLGKIEETGTGDGNEEKR